MKLMKLFLTVVLFFTFSSVFADNRGTVSAKDKDGNDLTVAPGETVDLYLFIDYSSAEFPTDELENMFYGVEGYCGLVQGGEISITLPEGFEFDGSPVYVDGVAASPSQASIEIVRTGEYLISSADPSGCVYYINKGALIKVPIKASTATASDVPYEGKIGKFFLTDGGWECAYCVDPDVDEPVSFNIYVKEATAESEDITLANTDSYNSYCSTKDLDFSEVTTAEAYVVTAVSATEATLAKVTAVPAGEGFLILGKGEASISVPVAASTPESTGTLLVGVTSATDIEEGNFGLATDGSKFVPLIAGTVPANKAYLPASAAPELGAKEFMLVIDGIEVTGISEIQTESKANGAIYNLNGARVSAPQKGVYIMNGRKVIVK